MVKHYAQKPIVNEAQFINACSIHTRTLYYSKLFTTYYHHYNLFDKKKKFNQRTLQNMIE